MITVKISMKHTMILKKKMDALEGDLPDDCNSPVIMELNIDEMDTVSLAVNNKAESDLYNYVDIRFSNLGSHHRYGCQHQRWTEGVYPGSADPGEAGTVSFKPGFRGHRHRQRRLTYPATPS